MCRSSRAPESRESLTANGGHFGRSMNPAAVTHAVPRGPVLPKSSQGVVGSRFENTCNIATQIGQSTCQAADSGKCSCSCLPSPPLLCAATAPFAAGCLAAAGWPCCRLGCLLQRLFQPKGGDDVLPPHLDAGYGAICRQRACAKPAGCWAGEPPCGPWTAGSLHGARGHPPCVLTHGQGTPSLHQARRCAPPAPRPNTPPQRDTGPVGSPSNRWGIRPTSLPPLNSIKVGRWGSAPYTCTLCAAASWGHLDEGGARTRGRVRRGPQGHAAAAC